MSRILHFAASGAAPDVVVTTAFSSGFGYLEQAAVDPRDGGIWLVDRENDRVVRIAPNGTPDVELTGVPTPLKAIAVREVCGEPAAPHCIEVWLASDAELQRRDGGTASAVELLVPPEGGLGEFLSLIQ